MTARRYAVRVPGLMLALLLTLAMAVIAPAGARADTADQQGMVLAASGDEAMESFDAAYELSADGSMKVTETIRWRFPRGKEQRGILRDIVTKMGYQNSTTQLRRYALSDVSVSSPSGAPDDVKAEEKGSLTRLRIGNPNKKTSGTQTYVVKYTLAHVLNPPSAKTSAVELYYNVFAPSEATPRENVSVTVSGPGESSRALCFRGERGSKETCEATPGSPTSFRASNLRSGQAMTIVAELPVSAYPNVTVDLVDRDDQPNEFLDKAGLAGGISIPVLAAALMGALWWFRGRDEVYADVTPGLTPGADGGSTVRRGNTGTVAVQFTPPAGVQAGMVGTLIDERADSIDVSATVVDLAVRGHLRIEEIEEAGGAASDWRLTRLAAAADDLRPYERQLLDGIFAESNPVDMSDLRNTFSSTLAQIKSEMYAEVARRGWFDKSPQAQRGGWLALAAFMGIGGVLCAFVAGPTKIMRAFSGGPLPGLAALGIGLILAGVIVAIVGSKMSAKTAAGSAVLTQSLGFKQYLVTAEAGQIAFEEAAGIFSRYLPYAVVFGVADRWAKVFAEVAAAAAAAGQPLVMPTWYLGYGGGVPDFGSFATGVDRFGSNAVSSFESTPGSSGDSGFSSGGGFSGGGGGGSSSGSW